MAKLPEITFILHNEEHRVKATEVTPETTLLQYLRDVENLKGTKLMCLEGGCGACIVAVTAKHPITKRTVTFAVNSCLVSIYSCEGWTIHTVDGIGNRKIGYHPIQKTLAAFNGTQCGFCSPGMVMNMYPLYESGNLKMQEVEDSFGGNMCRCTGYRPILTAFKSMTNDASSDILGECPDIEDIQECPKSREACQKKCDSVCRKSNIAINYLGPNESRWYKVFSINEIFDVLQKNSKSTYMLVGGNTAKGIYHVKTPPDIYIDVTSVTNLINHTESPDALTVGGNVTLTETINLFRKVGSKSEKFSYLKKLAHHLTLVAHVPVRNIGTLAGNLATKHKHPEFPSDIFLILETIGAKITLIDQNKQKEELSLENYLSHKTNRKVTNNVVLPALDDSFKYGSYKIMPRNQNALALVNAGFLVQLDKDQKVKSARIVYGAIDPSFVHATTTEKYLVGKQLFNNQTLQGAFKALNNELHPKADPPHPSPIFRKNLAIALFYKFILSIAPANLISPENKSGGLSLSRPISRGAEDYQTNKSLYPLTEPIPKLEALLQTSGELEYITDIPDFPGQLHACFVRSKAEAYSVILNVDASAALKLPGVVAYFDKNDIPGLNSFVSLESNIPLGFFPPTRIPFIEELFCSGIIGYYYQPLGMIVAKTPELAEKAADMVKVTYVPGLKKPLLTIREILDDFAVTRIVNEADLLPKRIGTDIKHVVKGTYDTNWQYHYHMETQITVVNPVDDVLDVYPGAQWMDIIQASISGLLLIPVNKINIQVKRVGGAFGGKIVRSAMVACAAALAAYKLHKPVRMRMSFSMNMDVIGKRYPSAANYEVAFNNNGEIQYLISDLYLDYGMGSNEPFIQQAFPIFYGSYIHDTWKVLANSTNTDTHTASWTRAPATNNFHGMIETIMEHCALELDIAPIDLRLRNMNDKKLIGFINDLRNWADYDNRLKEVKQFNKSNRWMKKGMALVPMTFPIEYIGNMYAHVAIYAGDGTVAVTHGGIEIGQGINTKVAQVCAYALNIPLELVSVKWSNSVDTPNNFSTAISFTSETCCYATLKACDILIKRMEPIKSKMVNPTWQDLIKACQLAYVNLEASHMFSPNDPVQNYSIYGVCAAEVEVDILTGNHQVLRVDLLEDTGDSISPVIDIGQVEGAFIMGLGFWTTERIVFDQEGKLLTDRTINYDIPGAKDIPIDFRVKFPKNNPNPKGILHSKATGEPALCLAVAVPIAIRHAVASARSVADPKADWWYPVNGPSSVENNFLSSLNNYSQYKL